MADRVTLRIEGLMLEKLLARALEMGAHIAEVRRLSRREMEVSAAYRSAKIVRDLAEKYSMRCELVKLTGKGAYLRYIRSRATAPAALLAFVMLCAMFLTRIWVINIHVIGGQEPSEAVYEVLEKYGAAEGMPASRIDTELLALELTALKGYSYASVAREGVFLKVELAEERHAPELYDIDYERDLVAACDAVIVSIRVKAGTARVKPGDTVRRGQVLISGEERVSQEGTQGVGALGSVIARVWCEGSAQEEMTEVVKDYTGRGSVSSKVRLFDYSVDLLIGDDYPYRDAVIEYLPVGGLFLPLNIERVTLREYEPRKVQKDEATVRARTEAAAYAAAEENIRALGFENVEIIDKWAEFSMIETDTLYARAVYELHAEIAVTRDNLGGR